MSPLLRELELRAPDWRGLRLPLAGWALAVGVRALLLAVRSRYPSPSEVTRVAEAVNWLASLTAQHALVVAVTHASLRRQVAAHLLRVGWQSHGPQRPLHHWSAWMFSSPMRTVLFICEHGSAKSVVAAAHFNRLAAERGLPFHAVSRGTAPDPANHPVAIAGLQGDRLQPQACPQQLSLADMGAAARVIAFAPLPPEYTTATSPQVWSVPPVSEGYAASRDVIVARIHELLDDLGRRQ